MATKKFKHPQVVTANKLVGGEVVYWTQAGSWSEIFGDGVVYETLETTNEAVAKAENSAHNEAVVSIYPFNVALESTGPTPIEKRELIRAAGPTVRMDLGKQAENRVGV